MDGEPDLETIDTLFAWYLFTAKEVRNPENPRKTRRKKPGPAKKYNHLAGVPGETIIGFKANLSYRTGNLKKLMPSVRIY
jgi:hypothetical protein